MNLGITSINCRVSTPIEGLLDEMKAEFIIENFHKLNQEDLEKLIESRSNRSRTVSPQHSNGIQAKNNEKA